MHMARASLCLLSSRGTEIARFVNAAMTCGRGLTQTPVGMFEIALAQMPDHRRILVPYGCQQGLLRLKS